MSLQLAIDVLARNKTSDGLNAAGKDLEKVGGKAKAMGKAALAGAAVLGGGMIVAGKKVFDLAAQMELMDKKSKIVFGDQITTVQKWAKVNARAMGLTTKEATGLAAGFADLLIPMGFTRKEAAKMSTNVVGLSGALAEWSGGTVTAAEVSDILSKAMLGERDGLKALGISISDADVKQRLLTMGKDKLTGVALQQATALATEQLIMEKSTDAQTAYAKGAGTLARKKTEATAALKEFRDKGVALALPLLLKLAEFIEKKVKPAVAGFITGMQNGTGPGGQFAEILRKLGNAAKAVGDFLLPIGRFLIAHPRLFESVAIGAGLLLVAFKGMALYGVIVARFMPGLAVSTAAAGASAAGAAGGFTAMRIAMAAALGPALLLGAALLNINQEAKKQGFKDLIAKDKNLQNKLGINPSTNNNISPKGGANGGGGRRIIPLAEGGIVRARPGGITAKIGEGRYDEAVIPLDGKTRGGGMTVVQNFYGLMDDSMVRKMEEGLSRVQRLSGTKLSFL